MLTTPDCSSRVLKFDLSWCICFPQGEWDGLGGMLKQWIRQRKLSKLSVDPNEAAVRLPVEDSDDEDADDDDANEGNLLASADACYKKWKSHFPRN